MSNGKIISTVIATSIGFVVVQLDVTIVNVALSEIGNTLGGTVEQLQWLVDAYTLPFAALLLSAGAFADRFGSRRIFLLGLAIFLLASLACALAPSVDVLVGARALQGGGAALILPTSLSLLSSACADDEAARLRAIGWWTAIGGAVSATGPILGGALTAKVGWWAIFLVNVPVCAISIAITSRWVAETARKQATSQDFLGQAFALLSILSLTYAITRAGAVSWSDLRVIGCLLGASFSFTAFLLIENHVREPMVPLTLFRNKVFSAAIALGAITNLTFYGLIFALGLFLQRTMNFSAVETGLALFPLVSIMLGNLMSAGLIKRFTFRTIVIAGGMMAALSFALLWGINASTPYCRILPSLILLAVGSGISTPALTGSVLQNADKSLAATASAIFGASRQVGGAVGVALFGALLIGTARS